MEFKDGKLLASGDMGIDGNKDGEMSMKVAAQVEIDAAEAIEEIARKDMPWLKALLSKLGV